MALKPLAQQAVLNAPLFAMGLVCVCGGGGDGAGEGDGAGVCVCVVRQGSRQDKPSGLGELNTVCQENAHQGALLHTPSTV